MTELVLSAAIGYGMGQMNPAALISKLKKKDLRQYGMGNLGATNTVLVFGKVYGIFVLLIDVFKAYFAIQIAKVIFPLAKFAGLAAGCFAVVGHIFPAYMDFHGGKGVAAFAGMILAYDVRTLIVILAIAVFLMIVTNFGTWGPVSAAILFPAWLLIKVESLTVFGSVAAVGGLIIYKHKENFLRVKSGKEILVNEFADEMHKFIS